MTDVAPNLAAALVAAQAEMPAVEPDSVNPHYKSKFVSLGHLIAKTRPVLNAHGLAISQAPSMWDGAPCLTTTIWHVSGEKYETITPLLVSKNDMQDLGSALTYARRYAWSAALGISDQDDDVNQASNGKTGTAAEWDGSFPPADDVPLGPVPVITDTNRKRLRAIQHESGVSDERLKQLVFEVAGVESSKLIPRVRYEDLCKAVKAEALESGFATRAAEAQANRDAS